MGSPSRTMRPGPAAAPVAMASLLLIAGCGAPTDAEFSVNEKARQLPRPARALVERSVLESFGTPQQLVAWLRLPVDYGVHTGEVTGVPEEPNNFVEVKWTSPADSKNGPPGNLRAAGLIWDHERFVSEPPRKGDPTVPFEVLDYDRETRRLFLNARMIDPPALGETFHVVGDTLQAGRRLYMQHCMHCHGVAGDGNGPTAPYLNPLPRDYRLGKFKFTSTGGNDRPTHADLRQIIRNGIPGTYMPSFLLMKDDELHAIIEYVRWLSMRGDYERQLALPYEQYLPDAVNKRIERGTSRQEILAELDDALKEYPDKEEEGIETVIAAWVRSEDPKSVVRPKSPRVDPVKDAESIARGRKLYLGNTAKCATCHGHAGRGDGPQTTDYMKLEDGTTRDKPGLFDDWGHLVKPRDLTSGIYRGGRRPLDIYRRIYSGIHGTPMPPFGTALVDPTTGDDSQIWDLVNYVMSVPYGGKAVPLPGEPAKSETPETVGAR